MTHAGWAQVETEPRQRVCARWAFKMGPLSLHPLDRALFNRPHPSTEISRLWGRGFLTSPHMECPERAPGWDGGTYWSRVGWQGTEAS